MKAKVSEVFESVQGEGIYFGEKQLFVRFFGCNLNCRFCDTKMDCFQEYEPQALVDRLKQYDDTYHSVAFTGGEPLLQRDSLIEVLKLTRQAGFRNYLETNGTLPEALEDTIDYLDIVAMDFKLPSSTGLADFWDTHRRFLRIASRKKEVFVKTVICRDTQKNDLVESMKVIKDINKSAVLVLQPNSYEDGILMRKKMQYFQSTCAEEGIVSCVIPQMHKKLGLK